MNNFLYLSVKGNALDRGREIGSKARKQIAHNIETYKQIFMELSNVDWETAKQRASQYIPMIKKYDEEIMQEIIGMSEGAEQSLLDLVALNARSEIILNGDGCTSLAALPGATKNQETLLAQNWDWNNKIKEGILVLDIQQEPKPRILMATEAGIVGKIGMNNRGLGVCLNLLGTTNNTLGVPIHVVLRGILNSKTLPQAVGQISRMPRGTSANYLLAHKEGSALNIETTSTDYDVIYPDNHLLNHTNHFVSPRLNTLKDTSRESFPDTHLRYWKSSQVITEKKGEITNIELKNMLANHTGYPDSICRHGELFQMDLGRPAIGSTVFSIIMNLTKGSFELSNGQPCSNKYETYQFTNDDLITKK